MPQALGEASATHLQKAESQGSRNLQKLAKPAVFFYFFFFHFPIFIIVSRKSSWPLTCPGWFIAVLNAQNHPSGLASGSSCLAQPSRTGFHGAQNLPAEQLLREHWAEWEVLEGQDQPGMHAHPLPGFPSTPITWCSIFTHLLESSLLLET